MFIGNLAQSGDRRFNVPPSICYDLAQSLSRCPIGIIWWNEVPIKTPRDDEKKKNPEPFSPGSLIKSECILSQCTVKQIKINEYLQKSLYVIVQPTHSINLILLWFQ